jgi:hypothetical protein
MRHAHQLLHSLQSLPSSQHPQRLPSLGYPSISLLLVKLVKHFRWMLPSYFQWPCHTYLALGGDKGTKLRMRLTGNGIIAFASKNLLSGERGFGRSAPSERSGRGRRPARRAGRRPKSIIVFAGEGYEGRVLFALARGTSLGGCWAAHIRRGGLPMYREPSHISRVR